MKMTETITKKVISNESELNRDPISGATGAHPVGTGAGAASGAVAGAAVGLAVGGPVGGMIGVAVGAVAGGLSGSSLAEAINPTAEEAYWRETYTREPYYADNKAFEYYAPGFRAGWEGRVRFDGRTFDEAESELKSDYLRNKTELDPAWDHISPAARAAWNRVDVRWPPT
jgi:hypothetical protein